MKYSELIGDWLIELGYTHCFFVAGGGIMHLLDGFRNRFNCIPVVHEMSAGICAEHFNECAVNGQRAFALVTTGPGLTNIVTAIAGCYAEHRELLVIAGQVKSTDLLQFPERQRGVQEVDGTSICSKITVHSECLQQVIDKSEFNKIVSLAAGPHPGPVVIEICLDVQGTEINHELLKNNAAPKRNELKSSNQREAQIIADLIKDAKRPLFLFGGLLSRNSAWKALPFLEKLGIPVATTTSAIDRIPTHSKIFAGRPGTWGGQRAGNLIIAQADLIVVFGAQLDLQQTGFNYKEYSPDAKIIHIFPSEIELKRKGPDALHKVNASPSLILDNLLDLINWNDEQAWLEYIQLVRKLAPSLENANIYDDQYIPSFIFLQNLSRATTKTDVLALCSSGGTFTGALQNYETKVQQIATTSAAFASMGYGLATAIGASFANPTQRVVMTEGEGGFSQNLQELAVIKRFNLPIKIFIFDNNGYASIRATQKKFFNGAYLGCDPETGLAFPEWEKLFAAYDIPCRHIMKNEITENKLAQLLDNCPGPEAWIVKVDPHQSNWPAVSTKINSQGKMESSPLYDMIPKLSDEIMKKIGIYLPKIGA